jgi:uncharacterized OB-fold protein
VAAVTVPFRVLPNLSGPEAPFWQSGARAELAILRCQGCRYWVHPPTIACPVCLSRDVAFEVTSGRGSLFSFAVSHQRVDAEVPVPYTIALVELVEQPGLRLLTNLVNCGPQDAVVDMPVKVVFEHHEDVFVPVFEPDPE